MAEKTSIDVKIASIQMGPPIGFVCSPTDLKDDTELRQFLCTSFKDVKGFKATLIIEKEV